MTDSPTMTYADEAAIARIGTLFAARTLPKAEWTHAAHFAAALWLLRTPGHDAERQMPDMIRNYNASLGGVNSDTSGYHETITLASIRAARTFLAGRPGDEPLHVAHAALMAGPCGDKDWLLAWWSRDRLMSVAARRDWQEPDIAPFPF